MYKNIKKPTQQIKKYDVNMLKDYNITLAYISCINEILKTPLRNGSMEERWNAVKETIQAANKTFKRITLNSKNHRSVIIF